MIPARRWCERCKAEVKAEVREVNHLLHLILTIITMPVFCAWGIVWIAACLSEDATCSVCGGRAHRAKVFKLGRIALLYASLYVVAVICSLPIIQANLNAVNKVLRVMVGG